ncbi:MAG: feruloyl-CoA synthase [Burkholderiales bacterium]|nr:feruloyl-CoA synthase [Burkholderiales bacterium]
MVSHSVHLFNDPGALAPPRMTRQALPDGGFILRHPEPLQPHARSIGAWLDHWAFTTPDATFLAERDLDGRWVQLSYRQTRQAVGRLGQALLNLQLPAGAPVVVLSDNSIDHALLLLASMHVGHPASTISSAYCRLTKDYSKVHGMLDALRPGLVYAVDPAVYGPALASWSGQAQRVFSCDAQRYPDALALSSLMETLETPAVQTAFDAVGPDHHAKYLLTSGSTGHPKVVINTHRMLTANQQQISQVWPFLNHHRLRLLDWLPWSHTFGANHNFNMVLAHGGSLHIDEGRPAPGLIDKTVRNLREVRPNFYFNVPRGFDMLLPYLDQQDGFAEDFFADLEAIFYAGAALPQSVWERLDGVARRTRERPVWFTSAWGATETAPSVACVHWPIERAGCIGAPMPGVELKFVPNAGKLELRVRGPNVFPGYRDAPELTAKAFDAEGYYLIGDAGRLVDPEHPECGVAFDGRVAEDFKLMSGTWVSVGTLRVRAVTALAPLAADVVVTGHDREEVGLLVFPSPAARELAPDLLAERLRAALQALRGEGGGSSQSPTRVRMLDGPPSVDAGEITDKGYINQGAVLRRRASDVIALYSNVPDAQTIRL